MSAPNPSNSRDLRVDSLRGLMLILMTVNHLPSFARPWTDKYFGVFSAAEGFVFLSGLLAGWVYTRKRQKLGSGGLWQATRDRAAMIYRWHIGAFLCCLLLVRLTDRFFGFCSENVPQLFYQHPLQAIGLGLTLLYQPGMLDILPLYCAVIVALPWVLDQFENGHKGRVLALSGALWLLVQYDPPTDGAPFYPLVTGSFNPFAWQFIFFLGVAIGHDRLTRPGRLMRFRPWALIAALAGAVFGFGIRHWQWRTPGPDWLFGIVLSKSSLGALRLVDFLSIAYLIGVLGGAFPRLVTWRPLAFLGRHSIVVFAVQTVTGIVLLQFSQLFVSPLGNWLMTAFAVALLFLTAWVREGLQAPPPAVLPAALDARHRPALAVTPRNDIRAA
jgi:hypothetical protein